MNSTTIVSSIVMHSTGKPYQWLPPEVFDYAIRKSDHGDLVHAVLAGLLEKFDVASSSIALPDSVKPLYDRELKRISELVDTCDKKQLSFHSDARRKDIAILSFRFIPVGAEFAEPDCRLWLRKIFLGKPPQFLYAAGFFLRNWLGRSPYFQLHMHQESHEDFHREGCISTFKRLADLLEVNPAFQGWFSSSWLIDPALENISPHLTYLRKIPEENGGGIFFVGLDAKGTSGALATSKTRRRLFDEGSYVPKIYLRVWPRKHAIAWRDRQS